LLDVLIPVFEQAQGCQVDLIAVGTGAALKLGEAGDVDVVLCHSRAAEEAFMHAGHGVRHEPLMHNFFLIVGPAEDPADIKADDAVSALEKIAAGQQRFLSRGDGSGTHERELSLWKLAGITPEWEKYLESGQGMGPTLVMADEMNAYTITDEGTWFTQKISSRLVPLVAQSSTLKNPYAAMVVNPDKHPSMNAEPAQAFVDYLISKQAQKLIADYQIDGRKLFHPDRLTREPIE
jgi:tungstate transport system substrate-binding protein